MTTAPSNLLLATCVLAASSAAAPQELRARFGFDGFEIYKFEGTQRGLRALDLNGDGRTDLAWVNDGRSRLDVLVRRDDDDPGEPFHDLEPGKANSVGYDGRFHHLQLFEEQRVQAMVGGSFGSGRNELVYVLANGTLRRAFLSESDADAPRIERETGGRIEELRDLDLLEALDLDGDGRDEVVAAADGRLFTLDLERKGKAHVIGFCSGDLDGIRAQDLDGDGRRDLVMLHLRADRPLRVRLGEGGGTFGPRLDFAMPSLAGVEIADTNGDGRAEILGILRHSGRIAVHGLMARDEAGFELQHDTFAAGDERATSTYGAGDVDGDGCDDLLVARGERAEVRVFRGRRQDRVLAASTHATLVGAAFPRVGDVDGEEGMEVVLLSKPERMLGVSRWSEGELGFPTTVALDGEPTALDLKDVVRTEGEAGPGRDDAVVVVTRGEGRRRETWLQVHAGGPDGITKEPVLQIELEDMNRVASGVKVLDLDGDGLQDVMVFLPGEKEGPLLLLQRDGSFVADRRGRDVPGLGILKGVGPAGAGASDSGGLVVAAGGFARRFSVLLEGENELAPRVHEQINATREDARFHACIEADFLPEPGPELVLLDAADDELVVLARRDDKNLSEAQRIPAGAGDAELLAADVDGDGTPDVVTLTSNGFAVLARSAAPLAMKEIATWDPPRESRRLGRLALGDFDHDGRTDIAVTEMSHNAVVLVAQAESGLQKALSFRVFETSDFQNGQENREPREIQCADIDGDGKDDLALLVHDKLIVYLQE